MSPFRLLAIAAACAFASAAPASAAPNTLKVRVHVRVTSIPLNDVAIVCGSFDGSGVPHIGSRPLSHVSTAPTQPLQWEDLTVPIPPAAFFVACWPSTNVKSGFNRKQTTRMVSARFPRPLPNTPIVMAPLIVVGNTP